MDSAVHSAEYYQRAYQLFHQAGMCELLVAEFDGKAIGGVDGIRSRRVAHGMFMGHPRMKNATGCQHISAMGSHALGQGPRLPENMTCGEYLMKMKPSSRPILRTGTMVLWGVYRYKRGFGGEIKRAAQALDRVYNPWLYQLYLRRMAGRESI